MADQWIEQFDLGQWIGRGGFATVYRAIHRSTRKEYAIKFINKPKEFTGTTTSSSLSSTVPSSSSPQRSVVVADEMKRRQQQLQRIENEMTIHPQLHHHNIVQCFDTFEDDHYACLLLEYCEGESLYRYLKKHQKLSEKEAVYIIRELLYALDYLHDQGVIHRDLKLSNILLIPNANANQNQNSNEYSVDSNSHSETISNGVINSTTTTPVRSIKYFLSDTSNSSQSVLNWKNNPPYAVKLCDFGLATHLAHPDEEHFTLCGTPNYIAPEIVEQKASHSYSADIWSLGCLFYTLVIGTPPFEQGSVQETLQSIVKGDFDKKENELSKEALSFLNLLLQLNPTVRPNVKVLLDHPLLTGSNGDNEHNALKPSTMDGDYNNNGSLATTAVLSCSSPSSVSKDSHKTSPTSSLKISSRRTSRQGKDQGSLQPLGEEQEEATNSTTSVIVPSSSPKSFSNHSLQRKYEADKEHGRNSRLTMPKSIKWPSETSLASSSSSQHQQYYRQVSGVEKLQNLLSFDNDQVQSDHIDHSSDHQRIARAKRSNHLSHNRSVEGSRSKLDERQDAANDDDGDAVLFRESIEKNLLSRPTQSMDPLPQKDKKMTMAELGSNQQTDPRSLNRESGNHHFQQSQSVAVRKSYEGEAISEIRSSLSMSTTSWSTSIHDLRSSFDKPISARYPKTLPMHHVSAQKQSQNDHRVDSRYRHEVNTSNHSPSRHQPSSSSAKNYASTHQKVNIQPKQPNVCHNWMDIMNCMREISSFILITKRQDILLFTKDCKLFYCHKVLSSSKRKQVKQRSSRRPSDIHHHDSNDSDDDTVYMRMLFSAERPHELHIGYLTETMAEGLKNDILNHLASNQLSSSSALEEHPQGFSRSHRDVEDVKHLLLDLLGKEHIFRHNIHIYSSSTPSSALGMESNAEENDPSNNRYYYFSCLSEATFTKCVKFSDLSSAIPSTVSSLSQDLQSSLSFLSEISLSSILTPSTTIDMRRRETSTSAKKKRLPTTLCSAIEKVSTLLKGIRSRIPKMILYLSHRSNTRSTVTSDLSMKCMLMCNHPLPDFHLQWSDGTRLVYNLQTSNLSIMKPETSDSKDDDREEGAIRGETEEMTNSNSAKQRKSVPSLSWEGKLSLQDTVAMHTSHHPQMVSTMLPSIPVIFHPYLLESQIALQRCIYHEKQVFRSGGRNNQHLSNFDSLNKTNIVGSDYKPLGLPIVVVEDL